MDNLMANSHHLLCDPVDDAVNSGERNSKHSGNNSVGCSTCQPEKKHKDLNSGTPTMWPILVKEVQQHFQRLPAQRKIRPSVLIIKKPVQDWDTQVNPAVLWSRLVKENKENVLFLSLL